jgi:CheY-like chemotaxis protein
MHLNNESNIHILVIDDMPVNRELLSRHLNREGY